VSSAAIEEGGVGAGEAAPAGLKALFFLPSIDYDRVFESLLRAMLAAGHQVLVALDHQQGGLAHDKTQLFGELRERYPGFDYQQLPRRKDLWRIPASAIRRSLDYLRYLGPGYGDADPLRERARERAPRLFRALLVMPPFRWQFGRRLIGWLLRRLEAGMPIPRKVKRFVASQAPGVVLVSPLVEFGSAQGDYIRTGEAAGIPSVLVVASGEDLAGKGAIRDVPTLTVTWNEIQVDEAVRLHGLPRERIVAVGEGSSNGLKTPAAPGAVEAIERAAPMEVVARREGRLLRPLLWLLTPLLAVALPFLRPRATGRAVIRTTRRLARRIGKRAKTRRRTMKRRRAERRRARAGTARQQKMALAEAREQEKARAAEARAEGRARAEETRQQKIARAEAKEQEKARAEEARLEKIARGEAREHKKARGEAADE